ncbi:MAG: hypothetical protein AAFQ57_05775 [Cyanobacteria bacterium J06626_14]
MNTNYSAMYSAQLTSEAIAYDAACGQVSNHHNQDSIRWTSKIQWRSLINQLLCYSIIVGTLLAALSMPFPAWLVTGIGLFVIATPDVNKAIADMMLTTFAVIAVGVLWHGFAVVSGLPLVSAILAYGAIAIGIAITGIVLLLILSSALMATNNRAKFLDTDYFEHYQTQFILASTSISGLTIGYWLVLLLTNG